MKIGISRRALTLSAPAGMNVYAASMLIPISVLLYTASGGLKATFTTSYAHTVIIYVALCLFTFTVYAGSKDMGIGSIDRVSPASLALILIRQVTPDSSKLALWRLCNELRALSNDLLLFSHTLNPEGLHDGPSPGH